MMRCDNGGKLGGKMLLVVQIFFLGVLLGGAVGYLL